MNIDKVAKAIEDDAGMPLPELKQSLIEMQDNEKYIYAGKISTVSDASGVSGMLIKLGNGFAFRRYQDDGSFTDYNLNHDDLPITIDKEALASFYSQGDNHALDHSPGVLGLKKVEE